MAFVKSQIPWRLTAMAAAIVAAGSAAAQEQPSVEEMWRIIQEQQREIESLKNAQSETDEKVEATGELVEEVAARGPEGGMVDGWWKRTSIGGYGELHYNGGNTDEIDFHRFVLYVAHQFSDRIRLQTEIELEHSLAGDGKPGEVELEQAYIEFDLTNKARARTGLYLIPVGILNEVHEPPTFFGVERNIVESAIIPTTWWEGGVAGLYEFGGGWDTHLAFHSGLKVPTTGGSAFLPRSGRQKVAEAVAEDWSATGRLRYTGMPGVVLSTTLNYQDDITQNVSNNSALLWEAHANIRRGPWSFRALYARWDIDGPEPAAVGRDEQYGFYIEPGYFFPVGNSELGVFAQYAEVDNNAGNSDDTKVIQSRFGVNFLPHPQVVLKADYQIEDRADPNAEDDRVNLGVGFMF